MITLADYYMGRDAKYPQELTVTLRRNADEMVTKANRLLEAFGHPRSVNSGWRPAAVNAGVPNASKASKHMTCQAIDLNDDDGALDAFCMSNLHLLEQIGLWLESPASTPRWCHVQSVPFSSYHVGGTRVFHP
jgi:hypothetical protein